MAMPRFLPLLFPFLLAPTGSAAPTTPATPTTPPPAGAPGRDPARLAILGPDRPRAFFFRAAEAAARKRGASYEAWEAEFNRLSGIIGKCLDEEVPGTEEQVAGFFTRFKQSHPAQVALLHFNGNSRDPLYQTAGYFPGHWIYRKAVRITSDIPAEPGETEIRVEDAREFRTGTGRYRTSADDIALFGIAPGGRHDWTHCEQVQLVSVDASAGTIRVRRGCYGTRPLAFQTGRARAAAHQVEGPWGKKSHLLWFYNFSTHCPRDARGRTCADALVDDLARWFGPDGRLAALDGVEFDVMFHQTSGDTDGDGEVDDGMAGGRNQYGIGVVEFARKLRARMGDGFILQGDGALGPRGTRSQRAWGLLNGIESEGFPNLDDWDMEDWSGGLNRHAFWQANARPPAFHYINHKWIQPVEGKPGETVSAEAPLARHRLVFAAAQFTDAMLCYSLTPPRGPDGRLGIWDELVCGADAKPGWLGKPLAETVHLAARTPDLLGGAGGSAAGLAARITGDALIQPGQEGLIVSARDASAPEIRFFLKNVPVAGPDLTLRLTCKAAPRTGYPPEMARLVEVTASGGAISLLDPVPRLTGMAIRGQPEAPISPESRAQVLHRPAQLIGDRRLAACFVHPPYAAGKGAVFWCRDADLPPEPELRFSLGMGEKSPQRSDGIWFQVWLAELAGGKPGAFSKIFERSTREHAWIPCSVPLQPWAGKSVRLKFVADCGPRDHAVTDQGYWGDVRIMQAGAGEAEVTPPITSMTWANGRPFTAWFHFRGIRSSSLDLDFRVEGGEPLTILALAAHAHPDAVARVFEHGIVLANPGLQPCTFDLQALSPGQRYRRLRGSAGQDPRTNDGSPVGAAVSLEERDGLFLVRAPD